MQQNAECQNTNNKNVMQQSQTKINKGKLMQQSEIKWSKIH